MDRRIYNNSVVYLISRNDDEKARSVIYLPLN